jgi:aspartyl/asparaginyl beta-hydroxylase (cupin superfamily)
MSVQTHLAASVAELHQRAMAALREQRESEVVALWRQILALAPNDVPANAGLGRWALGQRQLDLAAMHLERVAVVSGSNVRAWIDLALVHQQRHDDAAQEAALHGALKADPEDLLALLMRGALFERRGLHEAALDSFIAASIVAPPADKLSPDLQQAVAHARSVRAAHEARLANHMDSALDSVFRDHAGEDLQRFRLGMDILLGRKRRHDAQPSRFFMPGLVPVEFFDRAHFPWLEMMEAGTPDVRQECLAVLQDGEGITPYIEYRDDQPLHQWAELNRNPRWSCYHLWKDGAAVPEHVARCPKTMALIDQTPRPNQPGRTPVAIYSILKPRTRIPPHTGASNTRLLCHLPLIVPPGCSFRVGNTTREWVEGRAWVFDDTVEHEARNDSDQLRAILIFDTWHPGLTEAERRMITAMNGALNAFSGADAAFGA